MVIAERITADRHILGGIACIRGLGFSASDLLRLLASGRSAKDIVDEYPELELEDIPAVLRYAARIVNAPKERSDQALGETASS